MLKSAMPRLSARPSGRQSVRRDRLEPLLPASVCFYSIIVDANATSPWPEELALVASAGAKRRQQFLAGRVCAHAAMAQLGCESGPLLRSDNGAPAWPPGVAGSISHSGKHCLAAVAWLWDIQQLGIDIEDATRVKLAMQKWILTPDELDALQPLPVARQVRRLALAFSAKESAFKALSPLAGVAMHMQTMSIWPDDNGGFAVTLLPALREALPNDRPLRGRYVWQDDLIVTAMCIAAPDAASFKTGESDA